MSDVPSLFDNSPLSAFDPFDFGELGFQAPHRSVFGKHADRMMKTDIRETDKEYVLSIDLPGFRKEDIQAELKDGYLTISASKNSENEEKKEGRLIRCERMSGSCSRSFYVGDDVKQEDCKASYEGGVLTLSVPKVSPAEQTQRRMISIQ